MLSKPFGAYQTEPSLTNRCTNAGWHGLRYANPKDRFGLWDGFAFCTAVANLARLAVPRRVSRERCRYVLLRHGRALAAVDLVGTEQRFTVTNSLDRIIYALITGATFGWLWPR